MNFILSDSHKSAIERLSPEDQQLVTELWTSYSAAEVPEEKWRSMSSPVRKAFFAPFLKPTALSKRHADELQAKEQKASAKAAAKALKESEKARKLAEKERLAAMTPEERKAFKKKQKLAKALDAQNAPTLGI